MVCFLTTGCSGVADGVSWAVNYLGSGKAALGTFFCHQLFGELSALKMQISISIKTLSLQTKTHATETQKWFYSLPIKQMKVEGAAFLLKRSRWCWQLSAGVWAGLQQSGVGPLEVAAGGMSVAVKSLENVRNQKAKSINLLGPGTVLCQER